MKESNRSIIKKVTESTPNKWLVDAKFREANRDWLRISQFIALKVLRKLREEGITKEELSKRMNCDITEVNRLLKGNVNFNIETIAKFEIALDIELITKK